MLKKEGQIRIPSGCAISGMIHKKGERCINGRQIVDSIAVMHDRSNGLGGGFAGYGIYPEYADSYAFHVFYDDFAARQETEKYLDRYFDVVNLSRIPVRKNPNIVDEPLIWRYFVNPIFTKIQEDKGEMDEKKFIVDTVFYINTFIEGAYIITSIARRALTTRTSPPSSPHPFGRRLTPCPGRRRNALRFYATPFPVSSSPVPFPLSVVLTRASWPSMIA